MRLAAVVETSRRVTETTKRLEKVDLLARLLKQLQLEESQWNRLAEAIALVLRTVS